MRPACGAWQPFGPILMRRRAARLLSCYFARGANSLDNGRVVVIGASAGGIDALLELVGHFSRDFAAPICIVVHVPAQSPSLLAMILGRRTTLQVTEAVDGAKLENGVVYVARPDHHLTIQKNRTI